MADVVLLSKTIGAANYIARTSRKLAALQERPPIEPKFEPRSYRFALTLFALTVALLAITCGFFGRIIL
jgi:hypothetical protein